MGSVQIEIEAIGGQLVVKTLDATATAVQQSSQRMRDAVRASAEAQTTGLSKVSQAMREYRAEEVAQGRSIKFFTQELAGVLPVSNEVAGAIGRVAGALSMGFGLGLALEAVKWGLETFTAGMKKAKEEAEAFHKSIADTLRSLAEAPSKATILQAEGKISELREILANAPARIAEIRARDVSITGKRAREAIEAQVAEAQREIPRLERLIEVARAALAQASTTYYTVPLAPEKSGTARKDPLKVAQDETRGRLQNVRTYQQEVAEAERQARELMAQLDAQYAASVASARAAEAELLRIKEEAQRLGTEYVMREAAERERSLQHLTSQFHRAFASVLTAGGSFADKMKSIWLQVADVMIGKLSEWVAKAVLGHAVGAAAGAAESQAAIPIVGPILAAAAATAMFAMVSGLGAKFSASQGFDVPSGLQPVTQLHEREMVLPAELADRVRSMTGGGDTFVIQTMDTRGLRQFLRDNAGEFTGVLRRERRNRRA